ncbi:MAG: hypothetical protein IJ728_04985 [Selenomonadaceae bacterium]|nr:hypothetical protein [Selenomonadaceae bacterium]
MIEYWRNEDGEELIIEYYYDDKGTRYDVIGGLGLLELPKNAAPLKEFPICRACLNELFFDESDGFGRYECKINHCKPYEVSHGDIVRCSKYQVDIESPFYEIVKTLLNE